MDYQHSVCIVRLLVYQTSILLLKYTRPLYISIKTTLEYLSLLSLVPFNNIYRILLFTSSLSNLSLGIPSSYNLSLISLKDLILLLNSLINILNRPVITKYLILFYNQRLLYSQITIESLIEQSCTNSVFLYSPIHNLRQLLERHSPVYRGGTHEFDQLFNLSLSENRRPARSLLRSSFNNSSSNLRQSSLYLSIDR